MRRLELSDMEGSSVFGERCFSDITEYTFSVQFIGVDGTLIPMGGKKVSGARLSFH